jgi:hypothetical protein
MQSKYEHKDPNEQQQFVGSAKALFQARRKANQAVEKRDHAYGMQSDTDRYQEGGYDNLIEHSLSFKIIIWWLKWTPLSKQFFDGIKVTSCR